MEPRSCPDCGRDFTLVKSSILKNGYGYGVVFAALHDHDVREAWIDVVLGTFGEADYSDHVTFGCRVGPVDGQDEPAASLVGGAGPYGESPMFGRKLTRDEALVHSWLPAFWEVVDFVLFEDPKVRAHMYP